MLCGPQDRHGRFAGKKHFLLLPETEPRNVQPFFFLYLGPVCLRSGFKHRSLMAYCATLKCHSAHIQYPCVSYKETEVLN